MQNEFNDRFLSWARISLIVYDSVLRSGVCLQGKEMGPSS